MKRERWSIDDIASLPKDEDDRFDRKAWTSDTQQLRGVLGKAVSAFANSGGGHIFLGLDNSGKASGCPRFFKGRQSTKEWVEQQVRGIVEPPLNTYRVHEIDVPDSEDVVLAIDVDDSPEAPHQAVDSCVYYTRAAGRSIPARHFTLELLRNRATRPNLSIVTRELIGVEVRRIESTALLFVCLRTVIRNDGRTCAKLTVLRHNELVAPTQHARPVLVTADAEHLDEFDVPRFEWRQYADFLLPWGKTILKQPIVIAMNADRLRACEQRLDEEYADITLQTRIVSESHSEEAEPFSPRDLAPLGVLAKWLEWSTPKAGTRSSGYAGFGISYRDAVRMGHDEIETVLTNHSMFDYDSARVTASLEGARGAVCDVVEIGTADDLRCKRERLFRGAPLNVRQSWSIGHLMIDDVFPRPHLDLADPDVFRY